MEPRENPYLIGHEAAEADLLRAAAGRRLHHAWLLGGPRGVGKATLAFRFARWLLAGVAPDATRLLALDAGHPTFRRVAAGTHADLLTVELGYDAKRKRQRTEIVVDDVREVNDFMRLTPAEGGWRVVVVDGAEAMNRNSANALLKVLEEPPPRAVLLLVSHRPGALVPTLLSRCRRLTLAPLGAAAMEEALTLLAPELEPGLRGRALAMADGAPGRALDFTTEEGVAAAELAEAVLTRPDLHAGARGFAVADRVLAGEGAFSLFFEVLRRDLAQAVRAAGRNEPHPLGRMLAARRALPDWAEIWQQIGDIQRETEQFHLEQRQAVVEALRLLA